MKCEAPSARQNPPPIVALREAGEASADGKPFGGVKDITGAVRCQRLAGGRGPCGGACEGNGRLKGDLPIFHFYGDTLRSISFAKVAIKLLASSSLEKR